MIQEAWSTWMLKLRNVVQVDEIQHLLNLDHFFSYPGRLFFWGMKSCFVLLNVQYYSAIIPCSSHCTLWSVLLLSNHHSLSPNATHWIVETSLHTPWRCSDKDHLLQHDIARVMGDQSRALGYTCVEHIQIMCPHESLGTRLTKVMYFLQQAETNCGV